MDNRFFDEELLWRQQCEKMDRERRNEALKSWRFPIIVLLSPILFIMWIFITIKEKREGI